MMRAVATSNRRVVLARRPSGPLDAGCFAVEEVPVADLAPGEVLVANVYLSCDPYLRLECNGRQPLGEPVLARVAGEVVASADGRWQPGDRAWGYLGWEDYTAVPADALYRVEPADGPLSHALSLRGMTGLTAWAGMVEVGRPCPGDTVVVSAGTGAVGSLAGQLARLAGARVVAIVGGGRKAGHAVDHLGYHAAVDHRGATPLPEALAAACPDGIDVYFDNVGGPMLEVVAGRLNRRARVAACGTISGYDRAGPASPPDLGGLLGSAVRVTWFSVHDYLHELPEVASRLGRLFAGGSIVVDHDVVEGLERAPESLVGVLRGEHLGKRLVKIRHWPEDG
jgi:NADPH-dependent curcumin reductase CurA